jgi:hypothetical protein
MDDNNSEYAKSMAIKILEWLACSHRVLKIYEVLDGIAFQPGSTTLDNSTQLRREVLDLCRPLIEDGPSNTVDFVHFSAKEYYPIYRFARQRLTRIGMFYKKNIGTECRS